MLATAVHVPLNAEVKYSVNVTVRRANNVNVTSRVMFFFYLFLQPLLPR